MPILSNPSFAARTAVIYITTGALIDVWSGIWLWYLRDNHSAFDTRWYWCYGFLFTGLTLMLIGCAIGRIGRSARNAELPPEEVTGAGSRAEQNAAARAPLIAPVNPMMARPVTPNTPPVAAIAPSAGQGAPVRRQ